MKTLIAFLKHEKEFLEGYLEHVKGISVGYTMNYKRTGIPALIISLPNFVDFYASIKIAPEGNNLQASLYIAKNSILNDQLAVLLTDYYTHLWRRYEGFIKTYKER